jgi:hypothetical protein
MIRRLLSFFLLVGFGLAIVSVAARDMYRSVGKHSAEQAVQAQALLRELRGDVLLEKDERHYISPKSLPQRVGGSMLPSSDRQRLQDFLRQLLGFTSDEPAEVANKQ